MSADTKRNPQAQIRERLGPTEILTHSLKVLDLAAPNPSDILVEDVAVGLGNTCRFAGQGVFYSVAEHSVVGADWLARRGASPLQQLHFLLHDAHEAYLCDVPTPLKRLIGSAYNRVANQMQLAIYRALKLSPPDDFGSCDWLNQADAVMAASECVAIYGPNAPPLNVDSPADPLVRFIFWPPVPAALRWRSEFDRLKALSFPES